METRPSMAHRSLIERTAAIMATLAMLFAMAPALASASHQTKTATVSSTKSGQGTSTGYTNFNYIGYESTGPRSSNKYRMRFTSKQSGHAGVQGVYSEHNHYEKRTSLGSFIKIKTDDRSTTITSPSSSYSTWYYSRANVQVGVVAVAVQTRTCLDRYQYPNACGTRVELTHNR